MMAWRRKGDKPITWTNADPVQWRIGLYAVLEGDEFIDAHRRHQTPFY